MRALAHSLGFKTDKYSPKKIINDFKISDFNTTKDDAERWASRIFYLAEGSELDYDSMPAMVAAYDELQRKQFENVKNLRLDIHWMAPILGTSTEEVLNFLEKKGRIKKSLGVDDRENILEDRRENPMYFPTSVNAFVLQYIGRLEEVQQENPALLSDEEIDRRANTLEERILRLSYDKWAQKPIAWTWRSVLKKAVDYEENKENQDITKPSTAELVDTLFPTED